MFRFFFDHLFKWFTIYQIYRQTDPFLPKIPLARTFNPN